MLKKEENKIDVVMETTDENLNSIFKCNTMEDVNNDETVNVKKLKKFGRDIEDIYDQLWYILKKEIKEGKKWQY